MSNRRQGFSRLRDALSIFEQVEKSGREEAIVHGDANDCNRSQEELSNDQPQVDGANNDYYEISNWEAKESEPAEASVEDHPPIRKIFVGNLNERTNQHDLRELFGRYGEIMDCRRSRDRFTGIRRNYAFITYKFPEDAAKALSAAHDELFLHWRELRVAAADAWHQPQELPDGGVVWQKKYLRHQEGDGGSGWPKRHPKSQRRAAKESEKIVVSPQLLEARLRSSQEVDEKLCRIHILNDDCLMHIFSFLSKTERVKIERVCKLWQAVSRRTWLYQQHLDFNFMFNPSEGAFPTANVLRSLLIRCGPNLSSLDLSFRPNEFNNRVFSIVAKYSPNLHCLNASGLRLASHSMKKLSEVGQNLQRINFDGCCGLLDRDLRSLFQKCLNLESIVLSHNNQLTGKCLVGLRNDKLNELVLDHCNNLRSRFLADGLRKLQNLHHLSVNSCINLTSSDIIQILQSLPQLRYLSIGKYFPLLNSAALRSLEYLKDLVSLNLQHNPAVTDGVVEVISFNCLKLQKLNITGCSVQSTTSGDHASLTNTGFRWLARLPHLEDLSMSYLAVVTDEALDAVADRGKLKRLECRGCPTFTDAGCMRVIALCGELECFDFSGCDHVTNATIETALEAVKERTNNVKLRIIAGGTKVDNIECEHPLLQLDLIDFCLPHMRPDFVDDIYFQSSDNDEDDDDDDNEDFFNGNLEEYFLAFDDSRSTFSDDLEWDRYSYYSYDGYEGYYEY